MKKIISLLKMWKFNVKGTTGWDFAQVTGGGIPLDEIDENFQSKIILNFKQKSNLNLKSFILLKQTLSQFRIRQYCTNIQKTKIAR